MRNFDAILNTTPHYTDERYCQARSVFGKHEQDLSYNFSDQLWKQNYTKAKQAVYAADISGAKPKTARWYQTFLSNYFDYEVELLHILSGWNWSTGYPYIVFGYKKVVELSEYDSKNIGAASRSQVYMQHS